MDSSIKYGGCNGEPTFSKENKENRDNFQSKSDKKDALVIADMVKNG